MCVDPFYDEMRNNFSTAQQSAGGSIESMQYFTSCSPCSAEHGHDTRRVALRCVVDAQPVTPFTKNKQSIIICGVITTSASKTVIRHRLNHRYKK